MQASEARVTGVSRAFLYTYLEDHMRRLHNFDDWVDYFRVWQDSIGLDNQFLKEFQFDAKFADSDSDLIDFGHYKGRTKWKRLLDIPDQRVRDALCNLIVYQGDTEFASVEQQRNLLSIPPSEYDLEAIQRVMAEEMRHGWQMSYLLCEYFGEEGRKEAAKLLERRAMSGERLLGSFNEDVDNWVDFFTYTDFIDRDGKCQLKMLSCSAFEPLARSTNYMLKEESFHLGTGHNGLLRIARAGKLPPEILQRYINKWISTAYDLFGTDHSSSAHWAYVWGLKGRYDELENETEADMGHLNEASRELYRQECLRLVDQINKLIEDRDRWLKVPALNFNRRIGDFARQCNDVDGNSVSPERYPAYLASVMPSDGDKALIREISQNPEWIEQKKGRVA